MSGSVTNGFYDPITTGDTSPGPIDGTPITVVCFASGTLIDTETGPVAVETLRAGDAVLTLSGAVRVIRWMGHRHLDLTRHPDPARAQPVRVRANAIAPGAPRQDVLLSPDHAVLVNGVLVPIHALINHASIVPETGCTQVTYYHLELDTHDILLACGLPAESYLDAGNRAWFENAGEPLCLHPMFAEPGADYDAAACAPRLRDAAEIEAVWRWIAERAVVLGYTAPLRAFTREPDVHLVVDGVRLDPVGRDGTRVRFVIPAGVASVRLVSRAARPTDARPWCTDRRRLGIAIRRLTIHRGVELTDLALDDPALRDGWWQPEREGAALWRWTDGDALVPVPRGAACVLEVDAHGWVDYPVDVARVAA